MNNADSLPSLRHPIEGVTGLWEAVIGLEVHARIKARSKLFSAAASTFAAPPNSQVSLVDAGMPGMLPTLNGYCIEQGVRTGLGLEAEINCYSVFDRKNYFYPDLPQGYQISQYSHPLVGRGRLVIEAENEGTLVIGIERIHLEQDAGKTIHDLYPDSSAIDLNRSGIALMEIVTDPDMRSAYEARAFVTKLRTLLRYLDTCDGNMEEGSMRADVNVSLRRPGEPLGVRAEIKNVNSIRFIGQAIDYEIDRQCEILENGGTIIQETRLFDPARGETRVMRAKEDAHDYRYFPDPDLLPLILDRDYVGARAAELPELPDQKKQRFQDDYGLSAYEAGVLTAERLDADFFEALATGHDPKLVARWISGDVFAAANRLGIAVGEEPLTQKRVAVLLDRIASAILSERAAKDVFRMMLESGEDIDAIIDREGVRQINDQTALDAVIDSVIKANPDKIAQLATKPKLLGWFVGQVMQQTRGAANPQAVNKMLRDRLGISNG